VHEAGRTCVGRMAMAAGRILSAVDSIDGKAVIDVPVVKKAKKTAVVPPKKGKKK